MIARINKAKENDQGFTLIELLVVIIIIGILSAIAIPVFMNQSRKAVDQAAQADVSAIAKQAATYYIDHTAQLTIQTSPATPGTYTLISSELTGAAGTEGGPIQVPMSDDEFVAVLSGTTGSNYRVVLDYKGGTVSPNGRITYDAATGIAGPVPTP